MSGTFLKLDELSPVIRRLKDSGMRVVMCNGIFDLLHVGHVRYLKAAKGLGDILVVAINSDESAARLKGPARPYMPASERAEMLCAMEDVDYVTVFEGDTVEEALKKIVPGIHAKGTDYNATILPERELNESLGVEMAFVGDPKDHSTTDLAAAVAAAQAKYNG